MPKYLLIFSLSLFALSPLCAQGVAASEEQKSLLEQENKLLQQYNKDSAAAAAAEPQATKAATANLPGNSQIPLEKYDATAIIKVPDTNPQAAKPAPDFAIEDQDAPEGTEDFTPDLESDLQPVANPQAAAFPQPDANAQPAADTIAAEGEPEPTMSVPVKDEGGFKIVGKEDDLSKIPEGTLAVYIDVEEAFNKNPWTIAARKDMKLELETKQIEFAQLKEQLQELKLKEKDLLAEIRYYRPFYDKSKYVDLGGENIFPKITKNNLRDILNNICFCGIEHNVSSPENTPQKLDSLISALRDAKKAIIDKEAFLLNYKELSREEILSRQDYIVQQILKEIYSGIKEYAALRNIGLVVDKNDLVLGAPLNVTPEFVKWMKSYHKKYIKQNGDIL